MVSLWQREFKGTLAVFFVVLLGKLSNSFADINDQVEEPDFKRLQEHPNVTENTPFDGPFEPYFVPKPLPPSVVGTCQCGQHVYNGTTVNLSTDCGERPPPTDQRSGNIPTVTYVENGNVTDVNQFPWVVALVERLPNKGAVHFCGGTLISNRLVLTATHCFTRRTVGRTEIWVNGKNLLLSTDEQAPTLKIKAQRLIVHPEYNPIMTYNDITLVELSQPVVFKEHQAIRPICLPNDEKFEMEGFAYTAGWGQTSYKGPKSDSLRHVCLPLLSHDECITHSVPWFKNRITPWMICAGDVRNGKRDACPGDSGGPLFVESKGTHYLVGIVSWGEQCGLPQRPGVYTRVTKYLPWIYREAQAVEGNEMCRP